MKLKNLFFIICVLVNFQTILHGMLEEKEEQDTQKKFNSLVEKNKYLIQQYKKITEKIDAIETNKDQWECLLKANTNSTDRTDTIESLSQKNSDLELYIQEGGQKLQIEQQNRKRFKLIKANNSIAINELLQIAEDSQVIKEKVEEYKQQRLNEPKNPQIGHIIYKPVPDNFTISKIRNAIPSWSSLFLGYPTEHIKNIWRKPIQPVSTWEYIKSLWNPLPQIKEEHVKFEFVGFSDEMKKELEKLLTNKVIKNCTKITFVEDNNLATNKSVFDGDKVIPDHENPGYYFVHFDRTRNHSPYADPETRLKITTHNIENNPDYDAWKKLMYWKVFYGIVLGGSAALQAYRFFHLPPDAESTTNNSTQYIATAFAGTIGLFGGFLWGNKHKQTQEQKETEYRKAIIAKDGYYDDMAEDAGLGHELLYDEKIKRQLNGKEIELGDSLQEYGITMNPGSQQKKDLIKYAQSKGYPRYKLPAITAKNEL